MLVGRIKKVAAAAVACLRPSYILRHVATRATCPRSDATCSTPSVAAAHLRRRAIGRRSRWVCLLVCLLQFEPNLLLVQKSVPWYALTLLQEQVQLLSSPDGSQAINRAHAACAPVLGAYACAPMRMRVGGHDARCAVGHTGDHGAVQHEADAPGAHCCVRTAPYQRELPPPARHTIAPDSDGDNCQRAPPLTLLVQYSEATGCPDITCCITMQHTCCGGRRTLQQCCAGAPVRPCCGRSGSTFRRRPTHRRSANATSLCCDRSRTAPRCDRQHASANQCLRCAA